MSKISHNGGPPLDRDVPDMTYCKFYPGDFLNGTAHMTLEMRGAYITALAVMYDRMGGFPYDEREGGVLLRVDKRVYRRVRDFLIADGKFYRDGDMIRNARVEKEIESYICEYIRRSNAAKKREAQRRDKETSGELRPNLSPTSAELPPNLGRKSEESALNLTQKTKQKQSTEDHSATTYQNPEARSQKPEARYKKEKNTPLTPQGGNSDDLPIHVEPVTDWNTAFARPEHEGFVFGGPQGVRLANGTQQFWLDQFDGDKKALDLALIKAAASIQPNSKQSKIQQIVRMLSTEAAAKHNSDKRYERAAGKKAKSAKDVDIFAIMREMTGD